MASQGSTQALIKRRDEELALMPPPPTKRIKRPTEVLDEDEYTDALSDIIARDYYPGLREAKAQEEYLSALDSKNAEWIKEAGRKLQAATNGEVDIKKAKRQTRDTRFDTPRSYRQAADTPKGPTGADTPITVASTEIGKGDYNSDQHAEKQDVDTSTMSLSSYQAKYTSEDNASFNTLLDKQNDTRRTKHAHLWTADQRILSNRQLEYRKTQQKLIQDKTQYEDTNGKELIPLTTGATAERSAKPNAWRTTQPDNNFMFTPSTSVDEIGLQTIMEHKESMSKAGPKEIVYANTRFPPSGPQYSAEDDNDIDDTTSIHTSFIARRNNHRNNDTSTITGAETPRVNGYSFVDEDAPPPPSIPGNYNHNLLPSQTDAQPNPFKLRESEKRESLLHRLVERDAEKQRAKQKEVTKGGKEVGNMTPAAQKLLGRLGGKTPSHSSTNQEGKKEDWTPIATPRRGRVGVK